MSIWRQTGKQPATLADAPDCPEGCEMLWIDFLTLHRSRGSSGFGPARLTFADMDAFSRVTGTVLEPWEVDAIQRADGAYLASVADKGKS